MIFYQHGHHQNFLNNQFRAATNLIFDLNGRALRLQLLNDLIEAMEHVLYVLSETGVVAISLFCRNELLHDEVVLFVMLPFSLQIAELCEGLVILQLLLRQLVLLAEALCHFLEVFPSL